MAYRVVTAYPRYRSDDHRQYTAAPVDPDSIQFKTVVTFEKAVFIANNMRRFGVGMLRIAHNSLYSTANDLGSDNRDVAYAARNLLWDEIVKRDRL